MAIGRFLPAAVFVAVALLTFLPKPRVVSSFSISNSVAMVPAMRLLPPRSRPLFFSANDDDESPNNNLPLPTAPWPFTAQELAIREKELELLADLRYGDDNIHKHKFRDLWYSERGDKVEARMHQAWKDLGHPDHWPQAEQSLLSLCEEDPTYLQPFALLSKLYCLQGRFNESMPICRRILELKPYHFLVLETMVANSFALQLESRKQWEAKRLPPSSRPKERLEWVKRAVADATRLLEQAKQGNLPKESGSDEGIIELGKDGSKDAWQ